MAPLLTRAGLLAVAYVLVASSLTAQETQPTQIPACIEPTTKYPENMVHPRYPKEAAHVSGYTSVELRVVVAPDGQIMELSPGEGDNPFVNAAVQAVRKWRFYPTEVDGLSVDTTYRVHINFDPFRKEGVPTGVDLESPQPPTSPRLLQTRDRLAREYESDSGERVYIASVDGVIAPKTLYSPDPEFSERSRKARERGTVTLFLVVGTDGLPRNATVACSSIPDSNENALSVISRWRFAPGTKDGQAVPVALLVDFSFERY